MANQTTIQKEAAIRKGSVRVQVGDNFGSLTDIGALRNPVFTSLVGNQAIEFDNVDDLKKFVDGDKVQVTFDLAEINLTHLATLDAGLVTLSTVAGSPLVSQLEVIASGDWSYDQTYVLANQNDDGTVPTINSVTGGTDGALVLDTDYFVVKVDGKWAIHITDSATVTTEAQAVTVDSDYTPSASKKLVWANSGTKTNKVVRFVNTDENGNEFRIDVNEATNFIAQTIDFAGDSEEDVAILPIQLEGTIVEMVDEQQTT